MRTRKGFSLLLAAWVVAGLACNLPTRARLIERQVLHGTAATLTAIAQATLPAPAAVETPALVSTQMATIPAPASITPSPAFPDDGTRFLYTIQSGDTLPAILARFGVTPGDILATIELPPADLLQPGGQLSIANTLGEIRYPQPVLPDSEIVYSPTAAGFDIHAFVAQAGGFLATYSEDVDGTTLSGADVIRLVAIENSINPRLLLALIEYQSGWVYGYPSDEGRTIYPVGFYLGEFQGLRKQLSLGIRQLALGYYGWRSGSLTDLVFGDGNAFRIDPRLNAGSVAVQYLFSKLYFEPGWQGALYGERSFPLLYASMFGDPWAAAQMLGPLLPAGLAQPVLELPFTAGERWSLTGGPHIAWGIGSALAAIDFAPVTGETKCAVSRAWVLSAAPGLIVRSDRGVAALDLDGDGSEATGWVLVYMHVAAADRATVGQVMSINQPIGHPSCEGGASTGTHVHIARKFNGEWIAADGPLPLVLGGWRTIAGERPYRGFMANGDRLITANPDGSSTSILVRE